MPCRLCNEVKPLCNSHIIPEFFYKRMYDNKGRLLRISTAAEEKTQYKQKGIYEKLLCRECEQHISQFEIVTKRLFYDEMNYDRIAGSNSIKIFNLDYSKVKLFQLSLLWRASVAKNPFFENVRLGPHEERIRKMLLQSNPGKPYEYGCIIVGLFTDEKFVFDVISKPERAKFEGFNSYRFMLGGCIWIFIVSGQNNNFPWKDHFLQPDGSLLMSFRRAKEVPSIINMVQALRNAGKLGGSEDSLRAGDK